MASCQYAGERCYFLTGEYDLAIADLTIAIELDPADVAKTYGLRGAARAKTGQTALAKADFDQALSMATDPDVISAIEGMRCEARLGCE